MKMRLTLEINAESKLGEEPKLGIENLLSFKQF